MSKVPITGQVWFDHERAEQRDAIHVAIAPVRSAFGVSLNPGERVGFIEEGNTELVGPCDNPIGIVDPFLRNGTSGDRGEKFWLFLFPNTITSLNHVWTHPAFLDKATVEASKAWIEVFAAEMGHTYVRLMDAAETWVESRDGWGYTSDNTERYKDVDEVKWPLFWHHYEVVTGKAPEDKGCFFTCSC